MPRPRLYMPNDDKINSNKQNVRNGRKIRRTRDLGVFFFSESDSPSSTIHTKIPASKYCICFCSTESSSWFMDVNTRIRGILFLVLLGGGQAVAVDDITIFKWKFTQLSSFEWRTFLAAAALSRKTTTSTNWFLSNARIVNEIIRDTNDRRMFQ